MTNKSSIFSEYFSWLFNRDLKSEIPIELLKSSSPISNTYAISIFLNNASLNNYLNQYFNNIGLWYLDKKDLFLFLKKCVKDFRVDRRSMAYIPWKKTDKIFDSLRKRFPELKSYDISFICDMIDRDKNKEEILSSLGIETEAKKKKVKKENKKMESKEESTQTVEEFLKEHFKTEEESNEN